MNLIKGQVAWNTGKKCECFQGKNNGMYGKNGYDIWVEKYGVEEANIRKENRRIKLSVSIRAGKAKAKAKLTKISN